MGRTIPSYRFAVVRERRKWNIRQEFDKNERRMFNEMMSYSRLEAGRITSIYQIGSSSNYCF
jgi:hypothetical protein